MKRASVIGFLAVFVVVHAIVALWTPLQGDDWGQLVSAASDRSFLATHYQFSDLVAAALVRVPWFHVIVTPLVAAALIVGMFTVAMRRLPAATFEDALALALASALLWIAGPRAGLVWFHRTFVAQHVYGVAAALWLIAPLRCGWRIPRWALPLLAIAGYCVGTSTRTIATAMLVGLLISRPKGTVARTILISLVVGTIVGYVSPPWLEVPRVVKRGLDPNLTLLNFPIRTCSAIATLVIVCVLVDATLRAFGRRHADPEARPDLADSAHWFWAWFGTSVWALFGPRYGEATLLPATTELAIGALPILMWLASAPVMRRALVVLAVGVHVVVWAFALHTYRGLGREGEERIALLEHAPPGSVAVVPPYSHVLASYWSFGEDFDVAGERQLVANEVFGLRDIALSPPPRRYEPNPQIAAVLETDGVTDAQLRAAAPPAAWATDPSTARYQFTRFAKRLRSLAPEARASLRATNLAFDRPVDIAELAHGKITTLSVTRASPDANDRYVFTVRRDDDTQAFDTAWLITDGKRAAVKYEHDRAAIQPLVAGLEVLILCNAQTCLIGDAFVARF